MTRVIQFPRSISQCFTCCDFQDLSQVGSMQVPLGSHFRFYSAWDHNDNNKKGIWGFKLYEIMNNSSSIGIHYHLFFVLVYYFHLITIGSNAVVTLALNPSSLLSSNRSYQKKLYTSICYQVFFELGVPKIFVKFIVKHLYQGLFLVIEIQ